MKRAILHEGKSDKQLLEKLFSFLQLESTNIEFHHITSKTNFFKKDIQAYQSLTLQKQAEQLDKILFIIDADDSENDQRYGGYANTDIELKAVITDLGFAEISDYYIVCDPNTKTGYLESLILATLDGTQQQCIKAFLSCSKFSGKENHKAIINQIYKIAYPDQPYNFNHVYFSELITKIRWLIKEN